MATVQSLNCMSRFKMSKFTQDLYCLIVLYKAKLITTESHTYSATIIIIITMIMNVTNMAITKKNCRLFQEFADHVGISYMETSAKNADNVERAFLTLTSSVLKHQSLIRPTTTQSTVKLCCRKPSLLDLKCSTDCTYPQSDNCSL